MNCNLRLMLFMTIAVIIIQRERCKGHNGDFFQSVYKMLNYLAFLFRHAHLKLVDNYTYLVTILNQNGSICKKN